MKMSFCQMITIVCIFVVGFMTVAPFVQTADADNFWGLVIEYDVYTCTNCGEEFAIEYSYYVELSHNQSEGNHVHFEVTIHKVFYTGEWGICYPCAAEIFFGTSS